MNIMFFSVNNMYRKDDGKKRQEVDKMEERYRLSAGVTALICMVSLIISVITMVVCLSIRADMPKTLESITASESTTTGNPVSPIYYVGLHDEKIVVSTPEGDIVRELDAKAEFLPESEREMLRLGIAVYSSEQLYSVIENYME